jgi:alkylated DNA repair dioxygenase AlkB
MLTEERGPEPHPLLRLDTLEVVALWNLLRLRKAAMSMLRFDSGDLLGDHWLRSDPYRDRSYQPSLQAVQAWREASDAHIAGGVTRVDQAVCGMLGWDTASTVTVRALRSQFGYPDPGPAREKWLDSF